MERDVIRREVKSKDDFICFLNALMSDLQAHPDSWKNTDLTSFLRAMSSWVEDMGSFYLDESGNQKDITWQVFADMLSIARVYE